MKKYIERTVKIVNEMFHQDFSNEDELDGILYNCLQKGNEDFIESVSNQLQPEKSLFFITMLNDMASIKGYDVSGKTEVSQLYCIPFIAVQDKNNTSNTLSDNDLDTLYATLREHGLDEKYELTILNTMITPHSIPKEPIEVNYAHDSLILKTLPATDISLFSKGVSSFNKNIKKDKEHFKTDSLTFVLRYIMLSIREEEKNEEGVSDFFSDSDSSLLGGEIEKIIAPYYENILMGFIPIPYMDGVEIGIFQYNSMMALHLFMPFVETLGVERLDIVLDHSEVGSLKLMLVDKSVNTIVSDYNWVVPILSDSSIKHNIDCLQDFCKEIGFDGYSIVDNENIPKKIMH